MVGCSGEGPFVGIGNWRGFGDQALWLPHWGCRSRLSIRRWVFLLAAQFEVAVFYGAIAIKVVCGLCWWWCCLQRVCLNGGFGLWLMVGGCESLGLLLYFLGLGFGFWHLEFLFFIFSWMMGMHPHPFERFFVDSKVDLEFCFQLLLLLFFFLKLFVLI